MNRREKIINRIKNRGKLERKILVEMLLILLVVITTTFFTLFTVFFDEYAEAAQEDLLMSSGFVELRLRKEITDSDYDLSPEELDKVLDDSNRYGEFIDNWLENGEDEHYRYAYNEIEKYMGKNAPVIDLFGGADDVFILKAKRGENGEILNDMTVVIDVPSPDGSNYPLGYHFGESQAYETIKKVYETGEPALYDSTAVNSSGLVYMAFAPIKYKDGTVCAVSGLERSVVSIVIKVFHDHHAILLNAVVNFLLFGVIVYIFIKRRIVKPVNIISRHMNRFVTSEGALEFEPITDIHTNDEMEQIADDFNSLAQNVIDYTKNLEIKTTEEERLRVDLDIASQIRSVISSEITYPAFPGRTDFDMYASLGHTMYNKCSFVNYFFTDTDHLYLVLGESLGNSLASMIFSILSISFIKSSAKTGADPYKIAFDTNNQLCSTRKKDSGMTVGAVIADVDLKTGVMRYINAGMPPVLIKKPGENYAADKTNQPFCLGQMRGITFEQNSIQLYQGSTVLFTSFGISDMSDSKGRKYSIDRLIQVMNDISGNVYALNETVEQLENDLEKFRGDTPVSMDTAILTFRYFG